MISPGLRLEGLRDFFGRDARILEWGVAPARPGPHAASLRSWIGEKRHGNMQYMEARLRERLDPAAFHPWAKSAVLFSFAYASPLAAPAGGASAADGGARANAYRVAAYARGGDYHETGRALLRAAETYLREEQGCADIRFYGFVDTAPVFERDLASEAGLGWRGKNCCTLNRQHGSAFHLAGFFLDAPLPASQPVEDFCGGCTRCLDQCPTQAFLGPGRLDSNKCISYWTIEAKGEVPGDLSRDFGGWIFGCDVCQEVCPWNHKHLDKAPAAVPDGRLPENGSAWIELLAKGGGFQSRFKHSALTRAGRKSLLRNLAVAARNVRDRSALEAFRRALPDETDPPLREEIERTVRFLETLPEI